MLLSLLLSRLILSPTADDYEVTFMTLTTILHDATCPELRIRLPDISVQTLEALFIDTFPLYHNSLLLASAADLYYTHAMTARPSTETLLIKSSGQYLKRDWICARLVPLGVVD